MPERPDVYQSGNVLFESPAREIALILKDAGGRLRALLGEEPQILLRTVRQLTKVIDGSPFTERDRVSGAKLYVAFLSRSPRTRPALPLISSIEALEAIAMRDREVYIISRRKKNGFFGFPNNFIEERLGVPATSRNWPTVAKILEFARGQAGRP